MNKGFTLIELLVVLALLTAISLIVITAINPVEQARRTKDVASKQNASTFLAAIDRFEVVNDKAPVILESADSKNCSDIILAGPVYDFTSLRNEISDWFSGVITQPGSELYVGIDKDGTAKVCYLVSSFSNVSKTPKSGCVKPPLSYLCVPE